MLLTSCLGRQITIDPSLQSAALQIKCCGLKKTATAAAADPNLIPQVIKSSVREFLSQTGREACGTLVMSPEALLNFSLYAINSTATNTK